MNKSQNMTTESITNKETSIEYETQNNAASTNKPISTTVLLIENISSDAELILSALRNYANTTFMVEWVIQLHDAIERLGQTCFDVILLNLTLPDSNDTRTFKEVYQAAPNSLILVLGTADDEAIALRAVQHGAHDYLDKTHADAYWLPRALRYVAERNATELMLRDTKLSLYNEKERNRVILDSIGDAVLATDIHSNVTYLNPIAETLTGWNNAEANGQPIMKVFNIINGATRKSAINPAQYVIEKNQNTNLVINCILINRSGREIEIEDSAAPIRDYSGIVTGAVIVFHDSNKSQKVTERMAHMAQHDFLTGLPNRMFLTENIPRVIGLADRRRKQVAFMYVDIDKFKKINDTWGHIIGDKLLQSVSERLVKRVRTSDIVCRFGGDEFVIMLSEVDNHQGAASVAEMLLDELSAPFIFGEHELSINISIGISIYPNDGNKVDTLLQLADTAMYRAKSTKKSSYRLHCENKTHSIT